MRHNLLRPALVAASVCSSACSTMPNATVAYYQPKVTLSITVTQTATCTDANVPVLVESAEITLNYEADVSRRETVQLKPLEGPFGKPNVTFEFFPDGRLKAINFVGTGSGTEALKAIIKTAMSFAALKKDLGDGARVSIAKACKALKEAANQDKLLTIVHKGATDEKLVSTGLVQTNVSDEVMKDLRPVFGTISATSKKHQLKTSTRQVDYADNSADGVNLKLANQELHAFTVSAKDRQLADYDKTVEVWVPADGTYSIPIQKAPWFGTNTFALALEPSGRISQLQYAATSGAAGAAEALTEAIIGARGESATDKAKRDADTIYQQQRLLTCQQTPDKCPP